MIFIFKKKEITIDAFTNLSVAFNSFPIRRASKSFPDWWKKHPARIMTNYHDASNDNSEKIDIPTATIKTCDGIFDLYNSGFIIQLWTDLTLKTSETGSWIYSSKNILNATGNSESQFGENFNNYIHIKLISPWIIKEKTGVNFLFTPTVWNNTDYWNHMHFLPGVVNYKTQSATHVNLFVNKVNQTIHMSAGIPLAHVIPLSENKINIKCHLIDDMEYQKLNVSRSYFSYFNAHKNFKKLIEQRESESKCPFGFK